MTYTNTTLSLLHPQPSPKAVSFVVYGQPIPEGSLRAYGQRLVHNNDKSLKSWRQDVAAAAHKARPDGWDIHAPVELHCEFVLPRPKYHYGEGRNSHRIKDSSPRHLTTRPDTDKLTRAIGDSISVDTHILLHDDSQIVSIISHKRYANQDEPSCAFISVVPLAA